MGNQNPSSSRPRLIVVGAGIVGLGHAVAALDAGYAVTVVEQDAAAVLASVRNFGHVGTTVQAPEHASLASDTREIWLSLVQRAGVEARESGTLVVSRSDAETRVLEETLQRLRPEEGTLLDPEEAARMLHLPPRGKLQAGTMQAAAFLPRDLTANPRTAVARIAAWVQQHEHGTVEFSTTVQGIETGVVHTNRGALHADEIVVAAGHTITRLFPELSEEAAIRDCALNMIRVRPPHPMHIGPAVLTGTSMLRYGAFRGAASNALRAEMTQERPDLFEIDANIMFTQQADGTLFVGDTHAAHHSAPPFMAEQWSDIVLREVAELLGCPGFEVLERWQGIYATSAQHDIVARTPIPGVHTVVVTTGIGMTIGLGLGARTIAGLNLTT